MLARRDFFFFFYYYLIFSVYYTLEVSYNMVIYFCHKTVGSHTIFCSHCLLVNMVSDDETHVYLQIYFHKFFFLNVSLSSLMRFLDMIYLIFINKFYPLWALIYTYRLASQAGMLAQRHSSPISKSKPLLPSQKAKFKSSATNSITAYSFIGITKLIEKKRKKNTTVPFSLAVHLFRVKGTEIHKRNRL